ncbi:MAG: hypothetical protein PSX81_08080 [bacterium]|nr:hypothetical protein [bacterium]
MNEKLLYFKIHRGLESLFPPGYNLGGSFGAGGYSHSRGLDKNHKIAYYMNGVTWGIKSKPLFDKMPVNIGGSNTYTTSTFVIISR